MEKSSRLRLQKMIQFTIAREPRRCNRAPQKTFSDFRKKALLLIFVLLLVELKTMMITSDADIKT